MGKKEKNILTGLRHQVNEKQRDWLCLRKKMRNKLYSVVKKRVKAAHWASHGSLFSEIGKENFDICRLCGSAAENTEHILCLCNMYKRRPESLYRFATLTPSAHISAKSLRKIMNFLKYIRFLGKTAIAESKAYFETEKVSNC